VNLSEPVGIFIVDERTMCQILFCRLYGGDTIKVRFLCFVSDFV